MISREHLLGKINMYQRKKTHLTQPFPLGICVCLFVFSLLRGTCQAKYQALEHHSKITLDPDQCLGPTKPRGDRARRYGEFALLGGRAGPLEGWIVWGRDWISMNGSSGQVFLVGNRT